MAAAEQAYSSKTDDDDDDNDDGEVFLVSDAAGEADFCDFLYDEEPMELQQWVMPDYRCGRRGKGGSGAAYVSERHGVRTDFDFCLGGKRLSSVQWPVLQKDEALRAEEDTDTAADVLCRGYRAQTHADHLLSRAMVKEGWTTLEVQRSMAELASNVDVVASALTPSRAYTRSVLKSYVEQLEEAGVEEFDDGLLEALAASMRYESALITSPDGQGTATSATSGEEGYIKYSVGGMLGANNYELDPAAQKAGFAYSTYQIADTFVSIRTTDDSLAQVGFHTWAAGFYVAEVPRDPVCMRWSLCRYFAGLGLGDRYFPSP